MSGDEQIGYDENTKIIVSKSISEPYQGRQIIFEEVKWFFIYKTAYVSQLMITLQNQFDFIYTARNCIHWSIMPSLCAFYDLFIFTITTSAQLGNLFLNSLN